ncbi:TPA: hypothetical protein NGR22_004735 [Vibrio parahaemolyticus]|nr:hypothetical protein [Vibrio parahaemolyticus]
MAVLFGSGFVIKAIEKSIGSDTIEELGEALEDIDEKALEGVVDDVT